MFRRSVLRKPQLYPESKSPSDYFNMAKNAVSRAYGNATKGREKQYEAMTKTGKNKDIRKASSVIVVAPTEEAKQGVAGEDRFRIMFIKRSKQMKFMPNLYAFPGGKVDADDFKLAETSEVVRTALRGHPGGTMPWTADRITCLRELYEEVGVVLDVHGGLRSMHYIRGPSYAGIGRLVPFAHWITPPQEPRRFDTSFFLLNVGENVPEEVELTLSEGEIAEVKWLSPEQAIRLHNTPDSGFKLPPPTQLTCHQLGQFPSVGALIQHHNLRHRNDTLDLKTAEPFIDVSDGNFNMHFERHIFPMMDCGKHVFSLGYPIPPPFLKAAGISEEDQKTDPKWNDPAAKMIIHVGSELMEATNELHKEYYDRVIEHRESEEEKLQKIRGHK